MGDTRFLGLGQGQAGLLFYYTKIRFNTTIYDVCPTEQGQE